LGPSKRAFFWLNFPAKNNNNYIYSHCFRLFIYLFEWIGAIVFVIDVSPESERNQKENGLRKPVTPNFNGRKHSHVEFGRLAEPCIQCGISYKASLSRSLTFTLHHNACFRLKNARRAQNSKVGVWYLSIKAF
jgi:hypothetical protein